MGHGLVETLCQNSPSKMAWDLERRVNGWMKKAPGLDAVRSLLLYKYTRGSRREGKGYLSLSYRHVYLVR